MIFAASFGETVMNFLKNEGWDIVLVLSILVIAFIGIKIVSSILTKILYKTKNR